MHEGQSYTLHDVAYLLMRSHAWAGKREKKREKRQEREREKEREKERERERERERAKETGPKSTTQRTPARRLCDGLHVWAISSRSLNPHVWGG